LDRLDLEQAVRRHRGVVAAARAAAGMMYLTPGPPGRDRMTVAAIPGA
jgi:hypothetical protein